MILVASATLVGSAHYLVAILMCGVVACSGLWLASDVQAGWNAFSTLFAALSAWTLLFVVPLPLEWVEFMAHTTGEIWRRALVPFDSVPPAWVTLSLDPFATILESAKWASYAIVSALSCRLVRLSRHTAPILLLVLGCASLVCVLTLVHSALGLTRLYGIYAPLVIPRSGLIGPLLNPNNLACYASLGTFSGLALLARPENARSPVLVKVAVASCLLTAVMTASRAGITSLSLGLLLCWVWWPRRRERPELGWLLAAIPFGVLFAILIRKHEVAKELVNPDLTKLEQLPQVLPAVLDFLPWGTGRGGFQTVSERYISEGGLVVFQNVENLPLSWAVEWGLPVALLAVGRLAWLLRPSRLKLAASPTSRLCWIGVLVFSLHNFADLASEVMGIFLAASALLGSLEGRRVLGGASSTQEMARFTLPRVPRLLFTWGTAGVAMFASLLAAARAPDVATVRRTLYAKWSDEKNPENFRELIEELSRETLRRPAEPYFPLLAATVATQSGIDPLTWAAAALERAPHNGRAHYLTATALKRHGAVRQALMQLRLAAETNPRLSSAIAQTALDWTREEDLLDLVVPPGANGTEVLLQLSGRLPASSKVGRGMRERAYQRAPTDVRAISGLTTSLLAELDKKHSPCAESQCQRLQTRLEGLLSKLERKHPRAWQTIRLRARLVRVVAGPADSLAYLRENCPRSQQPVPCFREGILDADAVGNSQALRELGDRYLAYACPMSAECPSTEYWLAKIAEKNGEQGYAYRLYVRAASRKNTSEYWSDAARVAMQLGQLSNAELAVQKAERAGMSVTELRQELRAARSQEAERRILDSGR